jgi:hypothetical protein
MPFFKVFFKSLPAKDLKSPTTLLSAFLGEARWMVLPPCSWMRKVVIGKLQRRILVFQSCLPAEALVKSKTSKVSGNTLHMEKLFRFPRYALKKLQEKDLPAS